MEYGIFWLSLIVKLDAEITRNYVGMSSEKYLILKIRLRCESVFIFNWLNSIPL